MKYKYIKYMVHYCRILGINWYKSIYYIILGFKSDPKLCSKLERYVVNHISSNYGTFKLSIEYIKIHVANYCSVLKSHQLYCNKYLLMDDTLDYVTKRTINKLIYDLLRSS